MTKTDIPSAQPDADESKGVVEDDSPRQPGKPQDSQESMAGQLGHRNANDMTSGNDTDFPEPGARPEHSGEHK
jgi:hypothetical protein